MSEKGETTEGISSTSVSKVKIEPLSDDDVICDSPVTKIKTNIVVKTEPVGDSCAKMKITVKAPGGQQHTIEIKKDATTKEV